MGSYVPVMNESTNEMIYEIDHTLNCGCESSEAMTLAVMNANFAIEWRSRKNSGLQRGLINI